MPTVASQMQRWAAYAHEALAAKEPNYWSFQIRCKDAACAGSELVVAAGLQEVSVEAGLEGAITGQHSVYQNLSAMSVTYPIDGPSGVLAQPDRLSYMLEMNRDAAPPVARPATVDVAPDPGVRPPESDDARWTLPPWTWLGVLVVIAALVGAGSWATPWLAAAWRRRVVDPAARQVLDALAGTDRLPVAALVAATRRPESEVIDALARLLEAGRVTSSRAGGRRVYARV
jgi:hypothetical protein